LPPDTNTHINSQILLSHTQILKYPHMANFESLENFWMPDNNNKNNNRERERSGQQDEDEDEIENGE